MGDGMHEKDGSGGHNAPPSPHPSGRNFHRLIARSKAARLSLLKFNKNNGFNENNDDDDSNSTPATTSAPPSGGGPSGPSPAC